MQTGALRCLVGQGFSRAEGRSFVSRFRRRYAAAHRRPVFAGVFSLRDAKFTVVE
ncbi:MAG TPA: hypothetical protein VE505_17300 [Vicinamibacterales bacterium]|nr:hypothetical protein [Vicinamibacterales bacterium]